MNKSTKKLVIDRHRRKAAALRDRPVADRHGGASVSGALGFDSSPSNVSVRELEAYLDEAWRMIGSEDKPWDE